MIKSRIAATDFIGIVLVKWQHQKMSFTQNFGSKFNFKIAGSLFRMITKFNCDDPGEAF